MFPRISLAVDRLESRLVPAQAVYDDTYSQILVGSYPGVWPNTGDYVEVDWGDGSTSKTYDIGSGPSGALAFDWHDYDKTDLERGGEPYTIATTYHYSGGTTTDSLEQGVQEGQHLDVEYVPDPCGPSPSYPYDEADGSGKDNIALFRVHLAELEVGTRTITFDYHTADGLAKLMAPGDNQDYVGLKSSGSIPPGETETYIYVTLKNDGFVDEGVIEDFDLIIDNPMQANVDTLYYDPYAFPRSATGYILDEDTTEAGFDPDQFAGANHVTTTTELAEFLYAFVLLTQPSELALSVEYYTGDHTIPSKDKAAAATPIDDYGQIVQDAGTTITFEPGHTLDSFKVDIVRDLVLEKSEYFGLYLAPATDTKLRPADVGLSPVNVRILDWIPVVLFGGFRGPNSSMVALFDDFAGACNGDLEAQARLFECGIGPTCGRNLAADLGALVLYAYLTLEHSNITSSADAARPNIQVGIRIGDGEENLPDSVTASLKFNGKSYDPVVLDVPDNFEGDTLVMSLRPDDPVTATGVYDWSIDYQCSYTIDGQTVEAPDTISGRTAVSLRTDSAFGNGWELVGRERLTVDAGKWALYDYADGAYRIFDYDDVSDSYVSADDFGKLVNDDGKYVYSNLEGTVKEFDATSGNLLSVTDRHDQTITYSYDEYSRLVNIFDPDGRTATLTYDGAGTLVKTLEQDGGRVFTFAYDTSGNLETLALPDAGTITYGYDTAERLTSERWGVQTTTFSYDSQTGVLDTVERGAGAKYTLAISSVVGHCGNGDTGETAEVSDVVGCVIDGLDRTTAYQFDNEGRALSLDLADGAHYAWTYDESNRLVTSLDYIGTTTFTYLTETPFVSHVERPDGSELQFEYDEEKFYQLTKLIDGLQRITTITLNSQGDWNTVTDPEENVTDYDYVDGLLESKTDARGNTTTIVYDSNNRPWKVIDANNKTTTYGYDAAWNVNSIIDPLGHETKYTYDGMRRLVATTDAESATTTITYNAPGWVTQRTDALGRTLSYDYEDPVSHEFPGWAYAVTEAGSTLSRTVTFGYDAAGQMTSSSDGLGNLTNYKYDQVGRLTVTTDPTGYTSTLSFDLAGRPIGFSDAEGRLTTVTFEDFGHRIIIADAESGFATLQYDVEGNLLWTQDQLAVKSLFEYDGLDRVITATEADGTSVARVTAFKYDEVGNLIRVTDPLDRVTTYDYDKLNRLSTVTDPLNRVLTYTYDDASRLLNVTDHRNTVTSFAYDNVGRTTKIVEAYGDALARNTQTHYTALGAVDWVTDYRGTKTEYTIDDFNRVVEIKEAANVGGLTRTTTLVYDAADRLLRSIDPYSTITSYAYDAAGRATKRVDAYGDANLARTTEFHYDKVGNVDRVTDAYGTQTSLVYDKLNRLTQLVEANNVSNLKRTTTFKYDAVGRQVQVVDPLGTVTSFVYDELGRQVSQTDALGDANLERTMTWLFDAGDRLITFTDAKGTQTSYGYDDLDRPTQIVEALGVYGLERSTGYAYDATADGYVNITDPRGTVTSVTWDRFYRPSVIAEAYLDINNSSALRRTTTVTYDVDGQVQTIKNPRGYTTTLAYDELGRLSTLTDALNGVVTYQYDKLDRMLSVTDQLKHATTYGYDILSRNVTITDAENHTTTFGYDLLDRLVTVKDPRNNVTTTAYDELSRPVKTINALSETTTYVFDALDRLVNVIDGRANKGTLAYDVLGRLIAQTDPLSHTTTFGYDLNDNLVTVKDPLGNVTTVTFDELNRAHVFTDPLNHVSTVAYDANDNVELAYDPLSQTTQFVYDALNRLVQRIDAEAGVTTLAYDANDNLVNVIDPVSNVTTFIYDELDRKTKMTDPRGHSATFLYDAASRLTSETKRDSRRLDYTYNNVNQLTGEKWYTPGIMSNPLVTFAYDDAGNQKSAANANGTYTVTFDKLNRVETVQGFWSTLLTFTYDASGNRTRVEDNFGGTTTSVYDAANRLTSRQHTSSDGEIRLDYTYTARDELESVRRYRDTAGTSGDLASVTSYTYDDAGRTAFINHMDDDLVSLLSFSYDYDAANRVTTMTRDTATATFGYDQTDQVTFDGVTAKAFGYDANGNRDDSTYGKGNVLTGHDDTVFQFNDEGNLVLTAPPHGEVGVGWSYAYDHHDRLVSATRFTRSYSHGNPVDVKTDTVDYKYDAWGNLVERRARTFASNGLTVVTDVTERYAVDGWTTRQDFWGNSPQFIGLENFDVWADLNGSNAFQRRRLFGPEVDTVSARLDANDTLTFYLGDKQNTVVAVAAGATGAITEVTFDAWGQVTSGSRFDRYGYAGREHDAVSGYVHMRARWYDPETGRWITEDPLGFAAGDVNLYRYVGNGVTNAVDPSGLQPPGDMPFPPGMPPEIRVDQLPKQIPHGPVILVYPDGTKEPMILPEGCTPADLRGIIRFNIPLPKPRDNSPPATETSNQAQSTTSSSSSSSSAASSNTTTSATASSGTGAPGWLRWLVSQFAGADSNPNAVGPATGVQAWIPIWGSLRNAINAFQNGRILGGLAHMMLAVTDIAVVKSLYKASVAIVAICREAAPKSATRIVGYRRLTAELKGTGQQANHLNQNAAYRDIIPKDEGLAVGMRGNAFTEVGSPHYEFHRSLEGFWNQFRRGGARVTQTPTNAEYGQALEQALRAGGYSTKESARIAAQAARQRAACGLAETAPVPRIPIKMNQTPSP